MLGEYNFLLPVGQTFLRLKHWPDSHVTHCDIEADNMNFSAPRNDEDASKRFSGSEILERHADRLRNFQSEPPNKKFHIF